MTDDQRYGDTPLEALDISEIDWTHRAEHIRTRSKEKGPKEFDVEPEWASEAALDPLRIISLTGGKSIEVIGLSRSAPPREPGEPGRVLKVWIIPKDLSSGSWWGTSACEANKKERRRYWGQING
jgi:hypothetical protein